MKLAKEIIRASGRSLDVGAKAGWTFLFPTALPVEAGVRAILQGGLAHATSVKKRSIQLKGAKWRMNPDLVFGDGIAVGDVKYKLGKPEWDRGDVYEVLAFAAATETFEAAIINFREPASPVESIQIGNFHIAELGWPYSDRLAPEEAAQELVAATAGWLENRTSALTVAA